MTIETPIQICIGTEPKTEIARKVLEHSIRRRTRAEVCFHPMSSSHRPAALTGLTGFSLERWSIPERLGYRGKAIYLDADQLVLGDIRELWTTDERRPKPGASAWCVPLRDFWDTSVMLIDCAAARCWPTLGQLAERLADPPKRRFRYRRIMSGVELDPSPGTLEPFWNHHDACQPEVTRLVHFTDRSRQPWFFPQHPLAEMWAAELRDALAAGAVTVEEVLAACDAFAMGPTLAKAGMHPHWRAVVETAQVA